jgi:hypothetical protein
MVAHDNQAAGYEHYTPEADLVIPMHFDEEEVFGLLESAGVTFDVHRASGYYVPTLKAHNERFFGVDGVRRFIEYRQLGLLSCDEPDLVDSSTPES